MLNSIFGELIISTSELTTKLKINGELGLYTSLVIIVKGQVCKKIQTEDKEREMYMTVVCFFPGVVVTQGCNHYGEPVVWS